MQRKIRTSGHIATIQTHFIILFLLVSVIFVKKNYENIFSLSGQNYKSNHKIWIFGLKLTYFAQINP